MGKYSLFAYCFVTEDWHVWKDVLSKIGESNKSLQLFPGEGGVKKWALLWLGS